MSEPARDDEAIEQKRQHASGDASPELPVPESPATDVPPSADEAVPEVPASRAAETVPAAPGGETLRGGASDGADERAAAPALDGALGVSGDAGAGGEPAAAEALPPDAAASAGTVTTTATTATDAAPATTAEEVAGPRRRTALLGALRRVVAFALVVAIFISGLVLGTRVFQTVRPGSPVAGALDPVAQPPSVAQEFIRALAANDMDGVRSSLDADQHRDITQEMTRFGIHRVDRVEVLGTEVDGPRSATAIMMLAENSDGVPFGVNLVILVDGGKIEGFR